MHRSAALLVLGLLIGVFPAGPADAEIYRWTDASGREHFTTDLSTVPSAHRAAAQAGAGRPSDANINRIQSTPRSEPDSGAASPASVRDRPPEEEKIGGQNEATWRKRARRFEQEIENIEAGIERCEDVRVPVRFNPRSGRRMKRQHYERKMAMADQCGGGENALRVKRLQQENFLENARRRGVPPGWLR